MEANKIFKEWMDTIPYGKYGEVRQKVIDECKISAATYGNWRNSSCSIPLLAREKIELLSEELESQGIGQKVVFTKVYG